MSFVASDNRDIVLCLEAMKDLVIARGGLVHPSAQIEERDGAMRVICRDPRADAQTLFGIPHDLLVPLDELAWAELDDTLQLVRPPRGISSDQQEMLGLFAAIYNAAGKLNDARHHAAIVLAQDSELAAQTGLIKSLNIAAASTAASAFLSTRSFCHETVLEGKSCLMPLADFLNHHAAATSPQNADGRLTFGSFRAEGTEEFFNHYGGNRDPLNLALHYNYLDPASPYAVSVPLDLHLPGFGRLVVEARFFGSNHRAKPAKIDFMADGLTISHLVGDLRAPHRVRGTLQLAIMASAKRRGIAEAASQKVLAELPAAILAANRERLQAFQAYLATRPELPLASLLSEASRCQIANLERIFGG